MARVLVIGGGGREHALAWKLLQSPQVEKVFVAPGNAGTAELGENAPIHFTDVAGLLDFAKRNRIDLTVVGQEAASEAGVTDEFLRAGMAIFGPSKAADADRIVEGVREGANDDNWCTHRALSQLHGSLGCALLPR